MKNLLTFLVLFILCSGCNVAQEAASSPTNKVNPNIPTENALLWEITGNGLTSPSYLYGTIHLINKDDFFMTDATKKAFKASEKITFEINMEEMNDMSVIFGLMGKIMMDDNKKLSDLLTVEEYKAVEKAFSEKGMPLTMLERIKPMFLTVFASDDVDLEGGGMMGGGGNTMSYEMEFMQMANSVEKEMGGLETIDFQISMFDSIPYEAQAKMLVQSLTAEDTGKDEFAEMINMYKNQDISAMQQMINGDTEGIGEYEDMLLTNRNKNWIPLMAEMCKEKPTFFAVGAGHLGGAQGVIALMREAGYKMKAIEPVVKP